MFTILLLIAIGLTELRTDAQVLCVGIGAARNAGDEFPWASRFCPSARADAEAAFRELVPGAVREKNLYARPTEWDGPAVLLTDGVTDNRSIPVGTRILRQCRELAGRAEVVWISGIGAIQGTDSFIYDRMGKELPLQAVLNELPSDAPSRVVMRAYSDDKAPAAHTLYLCDATSAATLRNWALRGGRATEVLPGLSWLLETATPVRLSRLREQLARTGDQEGHRIWLDLGRSLERVEQVVRLAVDVRERPIFRKERKAGPFFTIVEVETDEVIGTQVQVNSSKLGKELGQYQLEASVVRGVVDRVETGAAASFEEEFAVGLTPYTVVFDKDEREVVLRYLD